jgi:pimeloyl-ACP methyl ester carboxylesterase
MSSDKTGASSGSPSTRIIQTSPHVSLEVIDWGGHGPELVFLTGLGHTAHVFDEFAPAFTDSFHVLGITRRGFGSGSGQLPANNIDTLVADITAVLDTLRLSPVVLVGHSIAGEEMTRFGEVSGTRCAGLIYLDAAYDRTTNTALAKAHPPPAPPPMRSTDSASLTTLRAYYARLIGVRLPESEMRALSRTDRSGRYLGDVTADSLAQRIMSAVRTPRWDQVRCRSLAIYAMPDSTADVFPYYSDLDPAGRAKAEDYVNALAPLAAASRDRFKQNQLNEVVEMRASHYLFLDHPQEAARVMRKFLSDKRGPAP